jgi:2-amino-4-hydroxy-6-hydroxymethyldihydropteridine diphosphokinase
MAGVAYIGVGSNVGDAFENCLQGVIAVIGNERATFVALSSLYRTSPVSPVAQADFLNCAFKIIWRGSPLELLSFLQRVEARLGRDRAVRFGPRTLDLDILFFDDLVLDTPGLIIPHPRLHQRKFALVPCLEIDPNLIHPRFRRPLVEYLNEIGDEQKIASFGRIPADRIGVAGAVNTEGNTSG